MEDFKFDISEEYKSPEAIEVAIVLLEFWLKNRDKKLLFYSDLCGMLSFRTDPRHVERFLGDISFACKENGLPPLSAIVVNKEECIPGAGFFSAYFPGKRIKKDERDEIIMDIYKEIREYPYWDKVLEKYKTL